jgi:mannose-6-phosphate isomerase-like protein (cupin superfamily)
MIKKVNLVEKFGLFSELWSPKIVGEVNDAHVKIGRLKGEFIWHRHEVEDEMFFVVKGNLVIRVRDPEERDISLAEGELVIIPKGIEHMPVSREESWIMMIEPKGTLNTGDVTSDRTVEEPEWI